MLFLCVAAPQEEAAAAGVGLLGADCARVLQHRQLQLAHGHQRGAEPGARGEAEEDGQCHVSSTGALK